MDIFRSIFSFGLYYIFVLANKMAYKRSFMLTNRRLVSHAARISSGVVYSSCCEIWFLTPISSYTIVKQKVLCDCLPPDLQFITQGSKFGTLNFKCNEAFIKTYLELLCAKKALSYDSSLPVMSFEGVLAIPEFGMAACTNDFLLSCGEANGEVVNAAVGAILPPTLFQNLFCIRSKTFTLTFSSKAVYIEAFDNRIRVRFFCTRPLTTNFNTLSTFHSFILLIFLLFVLVLRRSSLAYHGNLSEQLFGPIFKLTPPSSRATTSQALCTQCMGISALSYE